MAFDLSFGSLSSARERLANLSEPTTEKIRRGAGVGLTQISAFGFAWLEARYKNAHPTLVAPAGIPVSALTGVVLTGVSLLGMMDQYDDYLASAGAGALSVYFASLGASMGQSQAGTSITITNKDALGQVAATKGLGMGAPSFAVNAQQAQAMGQRRAW